HTGDDRGLTQNENNGSTLQSALSGMPSFLDFRQRADGSFPSTAPYASSNPFQTAALFQDRESVWRTIPTGRMSLDVVSTTQHTLRFIATSGADIFTQRNTIYAPPELQFANLTGLPGTSVLSYGQNLNYNANGNVVYIYKTPGGTSS